MTTRVRPIGAHSFGLLWEMDASDAVRVLAAEGFTRFELIASPPHLTLDDEDGAQAARIRAALAETGGEILSLDLPSTDVNLGSASPAVRAFAIGQYRLAIDRAAGLGAPWVVILAGRRHGLLPPPDARLIDGFEEAMDELAPHAAARGVRLLLEVHPQTLLPTAGELATYIERSGHDNLDILYDVPNGIAAGEDPIDGLAHAGPHLAMVHLSDAPLGGWAHDPIGKGDIDFGPIRETLDRIGFEGPVVLEVIAPQAAALMAGGRRRLSAEGWTFC